MGILRSETMAHGTLVIPQERARDCIDLLSRHTNIQFVDMNEKRMDRPYKKYVQRIVQMERMIRVLYEEIAKLPNAKIVKNHIDNFLQFDHAYRLDQVEESMIKLYDQFEKFKENNLLLKSELEDALNEYYVMLVARKQLNSYCVYKSISSELSRDVSIDGKKKFDDVAESKEHLLSESNPSASGYDTEMINMPLSSCQSHGSSSLSFSNISGLISTQDKDTFSRAIFRAMRGNVYTLFQHTSDLKDILLSRSLITYDDLKAQEKDSKTVFVIYCQSSSNSVTYNKLKKLCNGFQAKLFNWSRSPSETANRLITLEEIIRDKQRALDAYKKYFREEIACLLEVIRPNGNSVIEEWYLFCRKEKYLYYILNHFEGSDITLRADCWFPVEEEENIRRHLLAEKAQGRVSALLLVDHQFDSSQSYDDPENIPPTYNKTGVFSKSFQDVVDTYGIPRYKEVNPAPFTIMTFPFLFGIMFGDIGHGICVTLFGIFLIYAYPKLRRKYNDEIVLMVLNGRYMILLMGLMATYTGFIYNDFLSIPNNFFGSRWVYNTDSADSVPHEAGGHLKTLVPSKESFPIPFGLDAAWIHAVNEQPMLHSFKMKFAVIVGFLQMTMGITLKAFNAIYFKKPLDFFFEFLPQLAMMVSFVGYMNFLILHKWITPVNNGYAKPSIITTIIDMCLMKELERKDIMFEGQQTVQRFLMFVIAISVPLMLIPKPLILSLSSKNKRQSTNLGSTREHEMVYCGADDPDPEMHHNAEAIDAISPSNEQQSVESLSARFKRVSNGANTEGQFSVTIQKDAKARTNTEEPKGGCDESSGHNTADLFIHQLIETIEFSLGCVSNTASYLRLWALSLSHQQLSLVFFKQLIFNALNSSSNMFVMIPSLFVGSIMFAIVTFLVMLCMDSLECYLHALRLQWVEFQNKFYHADGTPFRPFNIKALLESTDETFVCDL